MINEINLNLTASFKKLATLQTDKKINLIYGLNGTGKSTLSNYLYDKTCTDFSSCSLAGLGDANILVYNQKFIHDYFYESDNLSGIFTLSKENKEAEKKIRSVSKEITILEKERTIQEEIKYSLEHEIDKKRQGVENKVWEIKGSFSGGDRVLEFCLDGLKGKKQKLFDHISSIAKPSQQPEKTPVMLKGEVTAIKGESARKFSPLPAISRTGYDAESNNLLQKNVIGNESSTVAKLIKELENQDWVKKGLDYLPKEIDENGAKCPFCQNMTITEKVVSDIKDYFDETYENDIKSLNKLHSDYVFATGSIQSKEVYEKNQFIVEDKEKFENLYNKIIKILENNIGKIKLKIKAPIQIVALDNSSKAIGDFNNYINGINTKIDEHNQKIDNKEESLNKIKKIFWDIMRWDYDQTLSSYKTDFEAAKKKVDAVDKKNISLSKDIAVQKKIIENEQKNTVNIEEAIGNINQGLVELGIDNFRIVKHSDSFYKVVRGDQKNDTFQTLSEGEKMIISFLYFCELCKGKKNATEVENKKIVVIDDPISSLSHIYIFNIGHMIKNCFFNSNNYEQVFVLTHSLYFFYELTDANHTRRKEKQKLFRMIKNSDGSQIVDMKYEEIQNDYHSYWHIVRDDRQPPALIANCMRNIIEYFFNFIEKRDLNNVFQKPNLQQNKYQSFCRYINRESHSLGQNIFDYKEFNYNDFKEAFGLVFRENGYQEHYEKMIN